MTELQEQLHIEPMSIEALMGAMLLLKSMPKEQARSTWGSLMAEERTAIRDYAVEWDDKDFSAFVRELDNG